MESLITNCACADRQVCVKGKKVVASNVINRTTFPYNNELQEKKNSETSYNPTSRKKLTAATLFVINKLLKLC